MTGWSLTASVHVSTDVLALVLLNNSFIRASSMSNLFAASEWQVLGTIWKESLMSGKERYEKNTDHKRSR